MFIKIMKYNDLHKNPLNRIKKINKVSFQLNLTTLPVKNNKKNYKIIYIHIKKFIHPE